MSAASQNNPDVNDSNISRSAPDCDSDLCDGIHNYNQSKTEINPKANINTTIKHKPYYQGERQLLGYDPLFQPSTVSFDPLNRPYIRTTDTTRPVIQTMCKCGNWV